MLFNSTDYLIQEENLLSIVLIFESILNVFLFIIIISIITIIIIVGLLDSN